MIKRQRVSKGDVIEIMIDNNYWIYAQLIDKGGYAFFNYKTNAALNDLSILNQVPILFIIAVYSDVVKSSYWKKVGKLPIRHDLIVQPMKYIQDALNPKLFSLYNPNTGDITSCKKSDCIGLECAAVWDREHVESRIKDFYNGVPNIWVDQLKIK